MKKILVILGGVVVVVLLCAVIGFFVPSEVIVERSGNVNATVDELQQEVTNFEKFVTWSPWSSIDPNVTQEFKGKQGEVGAEFHWAGNEEVGTGHQTVKSITDERVELDLVFTAPWESTSLVYYDFVPNGESTEVTWGYKGEMPWLMTLFTDMDGMLGGQYEKGLKTLAEKY